MFRIRKIQDTLSAANQRCIARVRKILTKQIRGVTREERARLPDQLNNPFDYHYRTTVFVAENARGNVLGFAVLLHFPDVDAAFLEYLSAASGRTGGGIGGGLYDRSREEAVRMGVAGLFFECSVDDPGIVRDTGVLAQNRRRMRFYEQRGARPIIGNDYSQPLYEDDTDPCHLMVDPIDPDRCLSASYVRNIVRAVLERKYGQQMDPERIRRIIMSFRDDPVKVRKPQYFPRRANTPSTRSANRYPERRRIALFISTSSNLHHVRDKGFVETPVRIPVILREIMPTGLFREFPSQKTPMRLIRRVHTSQFIRYLTALARELEPGEAIYPEVFPIRNTDKPPIPLKYRLGYFCIDNYAPVSRNAITAAREAVDCAVTGAAHIVGDDNLAYALVRPPGHHAEAGFLGGFCYLNSAAIAAEYLSDYGRTAVLDIDFHHGNGTQSIFYNRPDVLTVSIHGDPRYAFPHFAGFQSETGEGEGRGFNVNYPLPEQIEAADYMAALTRALRRIQRFQPDYLVVSLGLDTARADPTGTWPLRAGDFEMIGGRIGALKQPTLVIQEGGYRTRTLGVNARRFFVGLWKAH